MPRDKVRIRFHKGGDLRFVSHHDLMRCFERMLRRAGLPFHSSQGFHPKPRLVFALSLGLGIVGHDEVVELELDEPVEPEAVRARLQAQAPAGLRILDACRVAPRARARVRRVVYRLPLPAEPPADLGARAQALLQADSLPIERQKPQRKRCDLRPYLGDLRIRSDALEIDLWVTPGGTARPDEIIRLLGLGELLDAGAVLERTVLELHDDHTENQATLGGPRMCPEPDAARSKAPDAFRTATLPPTRKGAHEARDAD